MLLGAEIHIFIDHCNLTFTTLTTQCALCWCLFIKEFHPMIHFVKGTDNFIAYTLSCLSCNDTGPQESQDILTQTVDSFSSLFYYHMM